MNLENIVNIGYTDKLSYINSEIVNVYIDAIHDEENGLIYVKDINGKIVKQFYTKFKNQIYKGNGYDIYHYKNGLYEKPWEDFVLDLTCEIDINGFKSGIYTINDKIIFIVREYFNSTNRAPICCLISTNTISMYNYFGGKNSYKNFRNSITESINIEKQKSELNNVKDTHLMYSIITRNNETNESERAKVLQMNRPIEIINFFRYNYGLLKFLFNSNYKVNYITDYDLHNDIRNAYWDNSEGDKLGLFIISGHSEYWSLESRKNLEELNKNGTNILNLSGNSCWSRIKYSENKIIHQRFADDFNFITEKYKNLMVDTEYFCHQNYNSYETTGVDFLHGGHNYSNNKYIKFDNDITLLNDINEIQCSDANAEFDGFKTNFCIDNNTEINNIINQPDKIKDYKHLFELSKEYDNYKYKQILMYGGTPVYKDYQQSIFYHMKSTGILALKKNENVGIIINCCYSSFCSEWNFGSMNDYRFDIRNKYSSYKNLDDISTWNNSNKQKITTIFIDTLLKKNIDFNKTFKNNNKYNCPVCDTFMEPIENRFCNNCGSVERHRCLIKSIKKEKINNLLLNEPLLILSEGKRECNKYYESAYYFNKICKIDTMDIRKYGGTCFSDNQYYDYVHNCEDLSFIENNKYKAIVLNHVLSAVKNDLTTLSNFNRILKNDGILIITDSISNERETILYDSESSTMCCRLYGKDFSQILLRFFDEVKIISDYDSLTNCTTSCYICFKNNKHIDNIKGSSTPYKKNKSYLQ